MSKSTPPLSAAANVVLTKAKAEAVKRGHTFLGTEHFLSALFAEPKDGPTTPRIIHWLDKQIPEPDWKAHAMRLIESKKDFQPLTPQKTQQQFEPKNTIAMDEILAVAAQIGSGPIQDGSQSIEDGIIATEFILAAMMIHGVNVAAEVLGRASKGVINSYSILSACNVDPKAFHTPRQTVSQVTNFTLPNKSDIPTPSSSSLSSSSSSKPFALGSALPDVNDMPPLPMEDANWLIPGSLIIGAHPSATEAQQLRNSHGVTTFVSLIGEYSLKTYQTKLYPSQINEPTHYLHLPIFDFKVPTSHELEAVVLELKRRIVNGECIYLHCRGGHGRTGTVVIPLIAALYNLDNVTATTYVNECTLQHRAYDRALVEKGWHVSLPETQSQADLIKSVNDAVRMSKRSAR